MANENKEYDKKKTILKTEPKPLKKDQSLLREETK
jgi:hypothetical protein